MSKPRGLCSRQRVRWSLDLSVDALEARVFGGQAMGWPGTRLAKSGPRRYGRGHYRGYLYLGLLPYLGIALRAADDGPGCSLTITTWAPMVARTVMIAVSVLFWLPVYTGVMVWFRYLDEGRPDLLYAVVMLAVLWPLMLGTFTVCTAIIWWRRPPYRAFRDQVLRQLRDRLEGAVKDDAVRSDSTGHPPTRPA